MDKGNVYVGEIFQNEIRPVMFVGKDIFPRNNFQAYRYLWRSHNSKAILFYSNDQNMFGVIEINGYNIHLRYFDNRKANTFEYIGSQQAQKSFEEIFSYVTTNISSMQLTKIDAMEQKQQSIKIPFNKKITLGKKYYPNSKKYKFELSRSYIQVEDSVLSLNRQYLYTQNGLAKVCIMRWVGVYDDDEFSIFKLEEQQRITRSFQEKYEYLRGYITSIVGIPNIHNIEKSQYEWETSKGVSIKLFGGFDDSRNIILVIYKN